MHMQNNYTYHEFIEACEITGNTPTSWAEQNGLNRAMPTYMKQGVRPNPETLKKLISGWPRPELGLKILAAHLKDEIERAGVSLDTIEPVIKSEKPSLSTDKYLKVIAAFMNHSPIRESMREMAHLLLLSDWAHDNPTLTEELRNELDTSIDMAAVEQGAAAMLESSAKKPKSDSKTA